MAELPSFSSFLSSDLAASTRREPLSDEEVNRIRAQYAPPPAPPRNLFTAGIAAGVDQLQGLGGAALGAVGRAAGIEGLTQYGEEMSERNAREAAAAGRPDLEIAPWKEGGASFAPWAAYQVTKQLPTIAAGYGLGALARVALPVAATGAAGLALARFGTAVPRFLGGAGSKATAAAATAASERALLAGATETAASLAGQKAAQSVALDAAKSIVGRTAFGSGIGAGAMYQEAMERGEPTQGDAIKALALSPVYGALEAIELGPLGNIFARGEAGNIARRVVTGAAKQAITEPITEGTQTALENSFRPDLTMAQKAERIVDAAATSFVVGAGLGGTAGAISPSVKAEVNSPTEDLKTQVDNTINPASSLQQKYANLDTPAVIDRLARVEQRVAGGENTPAIEREFRLYRAEVSRRLSEMDDATVEQARTQVAQRIQAGDQSPTLQNAFRVYDGEIGRRLYQQEEAARKLAEQRQQPAAEQQPVIEQRPREVVSPAGGLFSEEALAQPSLVGGEIPSTVQAQQPAAKAQATQQIQDRISKIVGGKVEPTTGFGKWLQDSAPTTDAELVDAMLTRAEARSGKSAGLGKRFDTLAAKFIDPIAMQKELNAAQQLVIDAEIAVNNNKAKPQVLEAAQQQVNDIQSRMATYQAVVQERASRPSPAPAAPQGAPSVEVSPPASQTGLPPTTTMAQTGFDFNAPTRETIPAANLKVGDTVLRGRRELPITKIEPTETGNLAITMGTGNNQVTMRVPDSQTVTRAVTEIRAAPAVAPELPPVVGRERITQDTPREAIPASIVAVGDRLIQGQRALPITNVSTDAAGRVTVTAQQSKNKKVTMRMEPNANVTVTSTPEVVERKAAQPQQAATPQEAAPLQAAQEAAAANIDQPSPPPPPAPNEPVVNTEETQSVRSAVDQSDAALGVAQNLAQRMPVGAKTAALNLFKSLLGWMSLNHLTQSYDDKTMFNGELKAYDDAVNMPNSIKKLFNRIHSGSIADIERLINTNKDAAKKLYRLMTMPGIKIGATWEDQPWLHNEKDAPQLKKMVEEANDIVRWMRQNWADPKTKDKKVFDVYQEALDGNEMNNYARMATLFHVFAMNDEKYNNILNFGPDPMTRFRSRETEFQYSPAKAKEYWKGVLDTQLKAAKAFAANKKGVEDLNKRINEIEKAIEAMDRSTYFHLGRFGDYGVSFSIRKKDGDLDIDALNKLRKAMADNNLDGFEFMEGSDKTKAFLRFETVEQRDTMVRLAENLMKQGYIEPKSLRTGKRSEGGDAFASDKIAADRLIAQMNSSIDAQIARLGSDSDAAKALKKFKKQAAENLNMAALELSPENSIARVLARRKEVQGFSADAFRSLAYRYQVNADALANMSAAPYINKALVGIEGRVREAGQSGDTAIDLSNLSKMEAIRDELLLRSENSLNLIGRNWLDSLRAFSFAFFMSSASSAILQQGSVPVFVWPELGKKYGFVKAAKALGKAAPQAFKVMNAIVSMDLKRGMTRGPDLVLTPQALQKAGLDQATVKFVMDLANATAIDIGSAAREMGRVVEGSQDNRGDKALRWLGFMNSYSETFSRILTGLAARNLSPNDKVGLDYAANVITETLHRYDATNQSRQVGPSGIVGKYSPVALQFNNFMFFTMEKLHREMLKTISKNATPEEKAQARKFMGGFLATQTLMAGALGLPFATVLARVVEAMVETLGDEEEPFDAKTALKNYLNESFGADIGEIASSGIFRAAGVNIQARVGLQDLAPFSRFLADRRNFQDKFDDLVKDSAGAPVGAIFNALNGAIEAYKGNYIEGAKLGLPGAFKNAVAAYEMSDRGYVDKQGNVLPMSADANDILAALLGFQSAEMGRYTEGRLTNLTREGILSRRAGDLRRKAVTSFEKGDTETYNETLAAIDRFDRANPSYAIKDTISSTLRQRARARAEAVGTGTTIGTSLRDIEGIRAQDYVFPRQ